MAAVHIPEVIEPDEKLPPDLVALRRFADLMDEAFAVPGTSRRVGFDAVIGMIPGIGDVVTGAMSTWIIIGALRHRVPPRKILRMLFNLVTDIILGAVPVVGDLFDALYKQNIKNMRILMENRNRRLPPRRTIEIAGAIFLVVIIVLISLIMALVLVTAVILWITQQRLT